MITVLIRKFKAFFIRNLSKQKIISSSSFSLSVSQRKPLTPESLEGLESQSLEKPGNGGKGLWRPQWCPWFRWTPQTLDISERERKICETKCDLVLMCHLEYRNKVLDEWSGHLNWPKAVAVTWSSMSSRWVLYLLLYWLITYELDQLIIENSSIYFWHFGGILREALSSPSKNSRNKLNLPNFFPCNANAQAKNSRSGRLFLRLKLCYKKACYKYSCMNTTYFSKQYLWVSCTNLLIFFLVWLFWNLATRSIIFDIDLFDRLHTKCREKFRVITFLFSLPPPRLN